MGEQQHCPHPSRVVVCAGLAHCHSRSCCIGWIFWTRSPQRDYRTYRTRPGKGPGNTHWLPWLALAALACPGRSPWLPCTLAPMTRAAKQDSRKGTATPAWSTGAGPPLPDPWLHRPGPSRPTCAPPSKAARGYAQFVITTPHAVARRLASGSGLASCTCACACTCASAGLWSCFLCPVLLRAPESGQLCYSSVLLRFSASHCSTSSKKRRKKKRPSPAPKHLPTTAPFTLLGPRSAEPTVGYDPPQPCPLLAILASSTFLAFLLLPTELDNAAPCAAASR